MNMKYDMTYKQRLAATKILIKTCRKRSWAGWSSDGTRPRWIRLLALMKIIWSRKVQISTTEQEWMTIYLIENQKSAITINVAKSEPLVTDTFSLEEIEEANKSIGVSK